MCPDQGAFLVHQLPNAFTIAGGIAFQWIDSNLLGVHRSACRNEDVEIAHGGVADFLQVRKVEAAADGVDGLIHPDHRRRVESRVQPLPERVDEMRWGDDGPHRKHPRQDPLGDHGSCRVGGLRRGRGIGGQDDVRGQRGYEDHVAVVANLHHLRGRSKSLFQQTGDQVDVDERVAAEKGESRAGVVVRQRFDRPAALSRKGSHRKILQL